MSNKVSAIIFYNGLWNYQKEVKKIDLEPSESDTFFFNIKMESVDFDNDGDIIKIKESNRCIFPKTEEHFELCKDAIIKYLRSNIKDKRIEYEKGYILINEEPFMTCTGNPCYGYEIRINTFYSDKHYTYFDYKTNSLIKTN